MKRVRDALGRIVHLPPLATVLVAVPGFALVFYVLARSLDRTPLAYVAYPLSAYALAVVCAGMPDLVRTLRSRAAQSVPVRRLMDIPLGERLVRDELFRAGVGQYRSLAVNLLFGAIKLTAGILLRSRWFISLGVYYLLLAAMRTLLFRGMGLEGFGDNIPLELRRCRQCGAGLLLITWALTAMVGLMVADGDGYRYPDMLIYAVALHAFYAVPAATVNLVKFRRKGSPALYAAKALNLVAALVSMLALETALLDRFGNDAIFRRTTVGITGLLVCGISLAAALTIIIRSTRNLRSGGSAAGHMLPR